MIWLLNKIQIEAREHYISFRRFSRHSVVVTTATRFVVDHVWW